MKLSTLLPFLHTAFIVAFSFLTPFHRPAKVSIPSRHIALPGSTDSGGDIDKADTRTAVVIGNGMVGHKFIETLIDDDSDNDWNIVTFCEEDKAAYNRMRLTEYFKDRNPSSISMSGEYLDNGLTAWYEDAIAAGKVAIHVGDKATKIDTEKKVVISEEGREVEYDVAVLATGSYPFVPPIKGSDKTPGVFVYRTIDDLEAMIAFQEKHGVTSAAVIGGGLLGLEAAKAAYDLGMDAHIMEFAPILMCRQIDSAGNALLSGMIESLGLHVHCDARVSEVVVSGDEDKRVEGLRFTTHSAGASEEDLMASERVLDVGMIIVSAGIRPRDEVAKDSGIEVHPRGGVPVDDLLQTSDPSVYAIGEVALHSGMIYGLVAPGYDMAKKLAKNLISGASSPLLVEGSGQETDDTTAEVFTGADMSTKLKLMGVDVASFGDYAAADQWKSTEEGDSNPYHSVTLNDPVSKVYKKLIFADEGRSLIGGVLVGDASDYATYLQLSRSSAPLEVTPSQLISGITSADMEASGGGGGADASSMALDAQVCSCNDVSKGTILDAIKSGKAGDIGSLKACTKAGTGCGGCDPLVKDLFVMGMAEMGTTVKNHLCEHFEYSRSELFEIIKIKGHRTFGDVLVEHGTGKGGGCEICKPTVAGILASIYNDKILDDGRDGLQDTNDRSLANMQRGGSYSVIPRIAGGEIDPAGLVTIGNVAKEYNLYTKITGAQRIDMLGANKEDLPDIWEKLNEGGFESGHAYGKALRTVKSCVGSAWCRYGQRDSVKFAVEVENRYKGLRSPHKLKSAVSGCIRECAEARCKDFGMIATENGYNLYVCGNGGANPRHGDLLAADIDEETVIKYCDRFLIYYLATADRLQRTAAWLEKLDGGLEHLKDVVINDSLGLNAEMEAQMQYIVDTYHDEWADVVASEPRRRKFRQFANTPTTQKNIEFVEERGQWRPADWGSDIAWTFPLESPKPVNTEWTDVGPVTDFPLGIGTAVLYGEVQLAVFRYADDEWYATQNMCPHKRAFVLSQGILGQKDGGAKKVACPLHKKQFSLETGECLDDPTMRILDFPVRVVESSVKTQRVELHLPPVAELNEILATDLHRVTSCEPALTQAQQAIENEMAQAKQQLKNVTLA